eukprot:TRINITY_DN184_c0_g1_i10.p3 TRINITY_DN184_c0_g1~~TRINITY_DN184_c0_g1_i10.p3  ORF type:complete len:118 (+),score=0.85 TRINITY_DN184_c0_g1_i10:438-791(+)
MAVPKKKTSKSKTKIRKQLNWKKKALQSAKKALAITKTIIKIQPAEKSENQKQLHILQKFSFLLHLLSFEDVLVTSLTALKSRFQGYVKKGQDTLKCVSSFKLFQVLKDLKEWVGLY